MSQADNIIGHGQHGGGPGPEVMGASTLTTLYEFYGVEPYWH